MAGLHRALLSSAAFVACAPFVVVFLGSEPVCAQAPVKAPEVYAVGDRTHFHRDKSCSTLRTAGARLLRFPATELPIIAEPCQKCVRAKDLFAIAAAFMQAKQLTYARAFTEHCLQLPDGAKYCGELLRLVNFQNRGQLLRELDRVPAADLPTQRARLLEMKRLGLGGPDVDARLSQVEAREGELKKIASRYLQQLHGSDVVPPLPTELLQYVDYIQELKGVQQQQAAHLAVRDARQALDRGDFNRAMSVLRPFLAMEEVQLLAAEVRATVQSFAKTDGTVAPSIAEVERIESLLLKLTPLEELVGEQTSRSVGGSARSSALTALSSVLGQAKQSDPVAAAKVLQHKFPTITGGDGFVWAKLGLAPPTVSVRIVVAPTVGCSDDVIGLLRAAVSESLPRSVRAVDGAQEIVLALRDVACRDSSAIVESKEVPSTRLAGYQQNVNPDYVRLQTALQAAQADLARILANPGTGFAYGFAKGSAQGTVDQLTNELRGTPPFVNVPVIIPYTYREDKVERRTGLSASLEASDKRTGFLTGQVLSFPQSARGIGRTGVLSGDRSGFSNTEPSLPAASVLYAQSIEAGVDRVRSAVGSLGYQVFEERAKRAAEAKSTVAVVLGNTLFAREFAPDLAITINTTPPIGTSSDVRLDAIWRETVRMAGPSPAKPSPVKEKPAPAAGTSAAASSARTAVIQRVLRSVVTVQTAESSGSGFFVSADGHVLTNAHVVSGATKIVVRAQSGDTFLATLVRCVDAKDIALLRVSASGLAPLEIGDSDSVEVGADIIAVGSPMGLSGTVTKGILSAKRKSGGLTWLQFDAAINPGNSGGPLLTDEGKVIGISTWKGAPEKLESLGFAIGIADVLAEFRAYLRTP